MSNFNRQEVFQFNDAKELLYDCVKRYGKKTAFAVKCFDGRLINKSFENLIFDINLFGSGLFELGLRGKKVAILARNRYRWVVTYFACLLGGIVFIPLDNELSQGELEETLINSGVSALVYDEKYIAEIDSLRKSFEDIKFICMADNMASPSFADIMAAGRTGSQHGRDYVGYKVIPDAPAVILRKEGSADKQKEVEFSQRRLLKNAYDMQFLRSINSDEISIAILPFHHLFGLTELLAMLSLGTVTVFLDCVKCIDSNLNQFGVLKVEIPEKFKSRLPDEKFKNLIEMLEKDPRPAYYIDPERVYTIVYAGAEIKFTVNNGSLTVCNIEILNK